MNNDNEGWPWYVHVLIGAVLILYMMCCVWLWFHISSLEPPEKTITVKIELPDA